MIRVRFAPSPTGYLHVGNVRTALFNYLYAKHMGGKFILRIEDTDRERSKPEYEEALKEDLHWLGIDWDEGPYRQSERTKFYNEALEKLKLGGHVYPCFCTPQELDAKRKKALSEKRPPRYDGSCRNLSKEETAEKIQKGISFSYRFKIQSPLVEFTDLIKGPVSMNLDDMVGDFVVARQDGSPIFHLAVCVDDVAMQVTHVIRGEDHLSNTPRHILIFKALGAAVPHFAHMPLILGEDGQPLSKRLGDFSIREFRAKGYPQDGIVNYLALLGWSPGDNQEILSREALLQLFTIERVTASPARFNSEKMRWVLHDHFQKISPDQLIARATPFIHPRALSYYSAQGLEARLLFLRENSATFSELGHQFNTIFGPKEEVDLDSDAQKLSQDPGFIPALRTLKDLVVASSEEHLSDVKVYLEALKPLGLKGEKLYKPIRLLLTGTLHGPELKFLLPMIPKQLALEHIEKIEKLLK